MAKSYEELLRAHNEAARKWNELHKTNPEEAASYQAEYKKLWKQIQDLKKKTTAIVGGDE